MIARTPTRRMVSPSGAFAPIVPLPRRWARAKTWARRVQASPLNSEALLHMRQMERLNRG